MIWDAGALRKYRYNSPIYRYLSNNPPKAENWPRKWHEQLGMLLMTPGVSWGWVEYNFNMPNHRLVYVRRHYAHRTKDAWENVQSVTEENAIMYTTNRPPGVPSEIPFWVKPFVLDDLKGGMSWLDVMKKWGIHGQSIRNISKGVIGDVFHSGNQPRWRKNLDKRLR